MNETTMVTFKQEGMTAAEHAGHYVACAELELKKCRSFLRLTSPQADLESIKNDLEALQNKLEDLSLRVYDLS